MSLTCLQGAAIIAGHATFTKVLVSFTLRTYQFLETDKKRVQDVVSNKHVQQFERAQINESEYTALFVSSLLFLATTTLGGGVGVIAAGSSAATMAAVGQIGYVWSRTALGYPTVPTIAFAVIRYGGLILIAVDLFKMAF